MAAPTMMRVRAAFAAGDGERRFLQVAVALAAFVPVAAGLYGALKGAESLVALPTSIVADSHIRYLSGLLLAIGIAFWTMVPDIERRGARFSLLVAFVVTGGVARLIGWFVMGDPGATMLLALAMELVVTPSLWLWQRRVARRYLRPPSVAQPR